MKAYLTKGLFKELKNVRLFNSAKIKFDTVEWKNGADLDPEILYNESVKIKDVLIPTKKDFNKRL